MQTLSALILIFSLSTSRAFAVDAAIPGMTNTLHLMALAALGSVVPTTCRTVSGAALPPSVIEFSNASAAYILAEVNEATAHKANIDLRNAAVTALAERMKREGGGDVQKRSFEEALTERQYLLGFMVQRRLWLSSLIAGYEASASFAAGEENSPDTQITCTGTYEAALPLADALGLAFDPVVGTGPGETVATYLNSVLSIVAADVLPALVNPEGRVRVADTGSELATMVRGELETLSRQIEGNISDIQIVLAGFDSETGVKEGSGVGAEGRDAGTSGTPETLPATPSPETNLAAAAAGISASGSAAANFRPKTCAEKSPDGKSFTLKEICPAPAKFPAVTMKFPDPGLKSASEGTTSIANSLAKGDIAEARIAATKLNSQAANISTIKVAAVKTTNRARVQSGKPMINLSEDTKKAITKMNAEIKIQVTKMGGARLLASTTMPPVSSKLVAPVAETVVTDLKTIPARLRGRYMQELRASSEAGAPAPQESVTAPETSAPARESDPSLWERLTNRYRSNYGRFFDRKDPPKEGTP